jgi:tetratricopeptide (TPR) repeat protein
MIGRAATHNGPVRSPRLLAWRTVGVYLPIFALVVAALLIIRNLNGGGGSTAPTATIDPAYAQRLNDNIAFFEGRVVETNDSLSYNKLTGLYLQRFRETADPADIRRAEASAAQSLQAARGDYSGLVNFALVKIVQHDFRGALALATEAKDQIPTRPDAFAIIGDAQFALGRYAEATENYKLYLDNAPGFSAYSRQAALAEARGNVPLAEQFWQAAIGTEAASAPENAAWAHVQLGNLFFMTGRFEKAKNSYESALRAYPEYHLAQGGLARVAAARGDYKEAENLYQKTITRVPSLDSVVSLGEVYERDGRPDDAASQYALARAIGSLLAANGVRADLSVILFELDHGGDPAGQADVARAAYEERPSTYGADTYAWALYRAGRFDEARSRSEEALELGTRDGLLHFHAAMIALSLGDTDRARAQLEESFSINPKFSLHFETEAATTLKQLKGGRK